jgi:pyruvate formate lyase activating enzyme
LDDLIDEVEKDRAYFEESGGGITVSGGEPTLQADFVTAFLRGCKERGLHTALDTCGQCTKETLDMLLPYTDMVLYDIKDMDPVRHKEFTGHNIEKITENLIYLRDYMKQHDTPGELWIRTPIIPDATARDDSIRNIGKFLAANLGDVISRWELCSFNNLCSDKYMRLGLSWRFKDYKPMSETAMENLVEVAKDSGIQPDLPLWTGATRIEEVDEPQKDDGASLRLERGYGTA